MTSSELRKTFLNFFKKRGHKIVPSSSLIPEDRTVLLTTAGMQQFIPYLSGKKDVIKDFKTNHLTSVQKCFRTPDIEEIGDDTHHTFFEMLGNWSIGKDKKGEYFKEGAIKLALDFFVDEVKLDKEKFWATIFKGEGSIPRDEESLKIWESHGIPKDRIMEAGAEDNFWGPAGETGPCGPSSEIHYDRGEKYGCGDKKCAPNCEKCNRFVELWNLVFMEFNKEEDGSYEKLPQSNVDTGIGFERLLSILQKKDSSYETDLFTGIIAELEKISGIKYEKEKEKFRIISDHVRGSVFLISDGVLPSNVGEGYILRRIIRRAIRSGKTLKLPENFLIPLAKEVIKKYDEGYPEIKSKQSEILTVIQKEEEKFEKTLEKGLKQFEKISKKEITGEDAFHLYETYGFPLELTEEMAEEKGIKIDIRGFEKSLKKHQEISRAGAEKKFGGVGKGAGLESAKLHTATHLMHQALRDVLGDHVQQMGSDINPERLRFDFSHEGKVSKEDLEKVEKTVNEKIQADLEVKKEEMTYEDALNSGALAFFKEKYPGKVNVYSVIDSSGEAFSKEICAGPHAKRTSELGKFKIKKEESSGAGIRRIKAILEIGDNIFD